MGGGRGCQSEAVILFPDLATSKRQKAQLNNFKSSCWLYSGFPSGSDGKESACSEVLCLVTQSYKTLCDPMDCSPPVFSVRGDSPGKNTGVGCHALFQGTFPTQESNQGLLHCRWILYQLSYQASLCSGYRTGKGQCSFQSQRKAMPKNAQTTAQLHSSHTLKIHQVRLQQNVNRELPDVQAGFRKVRETRDQIANIRWIIRKAREFQKNTYFCFIDYVKAFDCADHHKLWEILKEMGIPDHLTCLLRNLYAGQEATVRTGHGTTDWLQIGKGVC